MSLTLTQRSFTRNGPCEGDQSATHVSAGANHGFSSQISVCETQRLRLSGGENASGALTSHALNLNSLRCKVAGRVE